MSQSGQFCEAEVPDTLDLAERAALALNGLGGTVDPADEYMMYFGVYLNARPPYMQHGGPDTTCTPKFLEAMPQMRVMCGSDQHTDTEQGMLDSLVRCISEEDGLYYAVYSPRRPWHMRTHTHMYGTKPEDCAVVGSSGMMMLALLCYREIQNTTRWDEHIKALARGMEKVAIHHEDYAYYPDGGFGEAFSYPKSGWLKTDEPADEHEGGEGSVTAYHGYQIRGLSRWAAVSGDEQALELAGKLARFVMKPKFWGNPTDPSLVAGRELGHVDSHFHARAIALRGLLEYGIVAGDMRACDFVRASYEYMRTYGISEIGFVPTWMGPQMEGCMLGDLVAMTIRMSDAGLGDYWEDADRIIRNHLAEAQYVDKSVLERVVANSPERPPGGGDAQQVPGFEYAGEDVISRALGIFGAWLGVTSIPEVRTMQCCTANAVRGLYYAWEGITRTTGDEAQVNLFLNRFSSWLNVESCLPYEGRVAIRNKTAHCISIRIPPWVSRSHLECRLNSNPRNPCWVSNYAVLRDLNPGDVLELSFPVVERTIARTAHAGTQEETVYTIGMRGNTVTDIFPREESPCGYPMYRREHLKADKAPLKTVSGYVAAVVPKW